MCISLKDILTKQSDCIQEMTQNVQQQNEINLTRLNVLEQYTQQMVGVVDEQVNRARTLGQTVKN